MTNSKIKLIKAKKISDSRGKPTIKVELKTEKGVFKASVPSGASTGKNEAFALEAEKAIESVNNIIAPQLIGKDPIKQKEIDELMIKLDGTQNKSKLGANAILAVSIAICRAGAAAKKIPLYQYIVELSGGGRAFAKLPLPAFNIINGGAHANNDLEIQEFMIIPQKRTFAENFQTGKEVYEKLKSIFLKEFGEKGVLIGDEGGFSPPIKKDSDALEFLKIASDGFKNIRIGLDCAATQLYREGKYELDEKIISKEKLSDFYFELAEKYPIIFIEDPFSEEDWNAWGAISEKIKAKGEKILIIGDDLTVTNKKRVERAIKERCVGGIIVKPNQIGTITETFRTVKVARKGNLKIIVSHRSGETMDDFIADLAVGVGADFIKSGAPLTKERMVKYNRLLEIENQLK